MSNVIYYYAELNDNNICTRIVSSKTKIVGSNKHIPIADYNETLYYRKWDPVTHWSEERYEPETDFELLQRIDGLEGENLELKLALADLAETYENKITELQLGMAELAERGE